MNVDIADLTDRSLEEKIRDFNKLLEKIESLDDKRRALWREIYQNAIEDRQNAYVMFVRLVKIVQDKSTEHAVHGKTIATYIERMSKANEQLIKLAELITKAETRQEDINPEDLFAKISSKD